MLKLKIRLDTLGKGAHKKGKVWSFTKWGVGVSEYNNLFWDLKKGKNYLTWLKNWREKKHDGIFFFTDKRPNLGERGGSKGCLLYTSPSPRDRG